MKRRALLLVGASIVTIGLTGFSRTSEPTGVPRLVVMFRPAFGAVPLGPAASEVYSFEVFAFDEEEKRMRLSDQTLVRDGQVRRVHGKTGTLEIKGVVSLKDTRVARYQAELLADARRVAATDASIVLAAR